MGYNLVQIIREALIDACQEDHPVRAGCRRRRGGLPGAEKAR